MSSRSGGAHVCNDAYGRAPVNESFSFTLQEVRVCSPVRTPLSRLFQTCIQNRNPKELTYTAQAVPTHLCLKNLNNFSSNVTTWNNERPFDFPINKIPSHPTHFAFFKNVHGNTFTHPNLRCCYRNKTCEIKVSTELRHSGEMAGNDVNSINQKASLPGYMATTAPFGTKPLLTKTPVPAESRELRSRVTLNPSVRNRTSSGPSNACRLWRLRELPASGCSSSDRNCSYLRLTAGSRDSAGTCLPKSFTNSAVNTFSSVSKTSSSGIILSWELSGTYRSVL